MRSLLRKPWPQNPDGSKKTPADYKTFLPDLIDNFGQCCCYCEKAESSLDVEHVAPKSLNPTKICDWDNLLLACPKCNRDYKKSWNPNRTGYAWPDEKDTFDIFEYHIDGSMTVKDSLSSDEKECAQKTIDLLGLNEPNSCSNWLCYKRYQQWDIASIFLKDYENGAKTAERIEFIVKNVVANGYWSVWMTVFKDYPEVTQKIADAFPGTLPKYCTPPANP